jgi:hypothetical protein
VYHGLYSEAVVSSVASAVALAVAGQFKKAVQYLQKAAKALYEGAREVFEQVKVTVQRLVELFVEAVTRVLAWVDEHKAYLFLMAAVAAGAVALSVALNLWGLVELEKLAYAASAPFVAGLADTGGKAAERFKAVAERYERWKMEEKVISEIINAPLSGERPYLKLAKSPNLPKPLVELRRALKDVKDEVEKDAAVVAALVLYKALVKNAEAYRKWAEVYHWARGLVKEREFTVKAEEVARLRGAQRRLEEAAEEVRRELNSVLTLYSQKRDLYEKLRPLLEVDVKKAEELAEARSDKLSKHSDANMGTKAYAALLSIVRGGIYGHASMLLAGESSLMDIVLLTPGGAYDKAKRIAKGRGEAGDPSYSGRRGRSVGQPGWEDRAASALLRYLLGRAVSEDLMFRRVGEGFEVFRAYGGVEARVDTLKIGESAASSKAGEEVLRRFVEEARGRAPNLPGFDKAPQYLAWRATDVTTSGKQIEAATTHPWQAAWYFGLLGEEESSRSRVNVTKKGVKLIATMYWPRERENQILKESRWLESVLGRRVESWRVLVDAINWRWVLKRVEEMAGALKPWIGPEEVGDAERERLARRMLGELALLVHFAEARRGKSDGDWREERIKRLSRAVEALSGGRIVGEYAEELARAIIYYAEGYKKYAEGRIKTLAKEVGVSDKEVWGVVEFVLSDMYCLVRDCVRDAVVRKFVAPALELIMLDKALRGEFNREETLLLFGEIYATAIAGDGTVGPDKVELVVGGELGGDAALLRLTTLHLLNKLLPNELKFNTRIYMVRDRYYYIAATGGDAARLRRLLAVTAPSAGGKYLSDKFNEFVETAQVEVRPDNIWLTKSGVAADSTISESGVTVKYNVYLHDDAIELQLRSTDRSRVELAARLLKLAGVGAEVKKEGGRDVWYVEVYTNMLAAGHEELRKALTKIVKEAIVRGWIDADKAEGWLEKLEKGRVLKEGWPRYEVGLNKGALVIRFSSTNSGNIVREAQRLRDMGLEEGRHFSVKMPEEDREGYVSILRKGLERAAWLSEHGEGEQRGLASEFVEYILRRAWEAGKEVYEKAGEIIDEGKARGSLTLKGFEGKVEVGGRELVVKVIDWGVEFDKGRSGKKLLRIKITAEVDDIRCDYEVTYGRYGETNAARGRAYARSETDAERFSAVIKALTGKEPGMYRVGNTIMIVCGREHLDGFRRYAELADAIEKWLEETGL